MLHGGNPVMLPPRILGGSHPTAAVSGVLRVQEVTLAGVGEPCTPSMQPCSQPCHGQQPLGMCPLCQNFPDRLCFCYIKITDKSKTLVFQGSAHALKFSSGSLLFHWLGMFSP